MKMYISTFYKKMYSPQHNFAYVFLMGNLLNRLIHIHRNRSAFVCLNEFFKMSMLSKFGSTHIRKNAFSTLSFCGCIFKKKIFEKADL